MSFEDKIKEVEEEIRKTPVHKASEHHIGKLKAKLAKLKTELVKVKAGKAGLGYGIRKTGDATVIICGFPSVGKSTLLNLLTNAKSKVAEYDFTTLKVIPGVMKYKGAELQLLDVPGLVSGAASGKGRGREVLSVIKNADLLLIMVDAQKPEHLEEIKKELYEANLRINQKPPDVRIKKKSIGGIKMDKLSKSRLNRELVTGILSEFGIHNADVSIREQVSLDQFIDAVEGNRSYTPAIFILNKIDLVKKAPELKESYTGISAKNNFGVDKLRTQIFEKLGFIRIYMKPQGEKADLEEPLIMKKGCSIGDVCKALHREFRKNFRYAQISGPSARFENQKVGLKHKLKDTDIVTLVIKE